MNNMKNSIKREQSQACLNFAERKNFRLQAKHKILMTLALLITAVGGAWAQDAYEEITTQTSGTKEYTGEHIKIVGTLISGNGLRMASSGDNKVTISTLNGKVIKRVEMHIENAYNWQNTNKVVSTSGNEAEGTYQDGNTIILSNENASEITLSVTDPYACSIDINTWKVYYGDPDIEVKWDAATKTGTFVMPAFDVEIAPIYAPTAQWAKDKEVDQIPAAIEGIFAGTTDAIVTAGTVVEGQGQAMYFATTDAEMTAEKAAQADGWLATVPTAEGYDGAQTVYVWYYIKGADTPQGEKATAENTFNDSEICAEPIKVEVLSNKFDINFNAANDNTIETGKATVTVGGTAATVTEGKLEGVKMGSEVKVTAKEGYKFRKVEGKKVDPAKTYLKWNAGQKKLVATDIPAGATTVQNADQNVDWPTGTYVVEDDVTISGTITLTGDVNLIIKDGAKLTANQIWGGSSFYNLSIYGQASQSGQLVVNYSDDDAIYNIKTLAVHSCQVKATASGDACGGFYNIGTFNVYGGSVDAGNTGCEEGGYGIELANYGLMNIYGGEVKAVGKGTDCGIKCMSSSSVIVYGGKLWAENAGNKAIDSDEITLTKGAGFSGKIQTSDNGSSWTEYTEASTPSAKYVRVGY